MPANAARRIVTQPAQRRGDGHIQSRVHNLTAPRLQQHLHRLDHASPPTRHKNTEPNTNPTHLKPLQINTFKVTVLGVLGLLGFSALA